MYTLIEIFDSKQYENILSPVFLDRVAKVIYVGSKEVMTAKKISYIKNFFAHIKYTVPVEFLYVDRDNSSSVMNRFSQIIQNNSNCIFDATGGEDVILTTLGIASERYSVPVLRVDVKNRNFVIVHGNSADLCMKDVSLTPEDLVILQGGRMIRSSDLSFLNSAEISDIKKMFSVNSTDCESYSSFCTFAAEFLNSSEQRLVFDRELYHKRNLQLKGKLDYIIDLLCDERLLIRVSPLSFKVKSKAVSRCILKAGNVLEYYSAIALQSLPDTFSHIRVGATVELNDPDSFFETQNEIDVMAIHKGVPVFISCKNGEIKKDALYEIDAVSRALGGPYAKKVLVCTYISKNKTSQRHFINRALDMGIGLVYNTHKLSYDDFLKLLDKIVR